MGSTYKFECPDCHYSVEVSGRLDYGFFAVVKTMTCTNCQELVDVLVGKNGPVGPTGDPEYDRKLNICPDCKGTDVHPWPESHPCPRCDGLMTSDGEITVLWD